MGEPGNREASTEVAAVRPRPSSQASTGVDATDPIAAKSLTGRRMPLRRPAIVMDRPPAPDVKALRAQFAPARLRGFAQSSPGRLVAAGLVLMALCVATGAVTSTVVSDRQQALGVLLDDTEPDAHSANHLYTSLSIADAAAGTAFIAGGLEPAAVRDRYTQAIGEAAAELVTQAGHTATDQDPASDRRLRTGIATGLPVYTGLIETARANNRNGYPVGAAYLSEASHQMQTSLLPMAEELENHRFDAVTAAQHRHVQPPWTAIVLLVLALAALIWVQVELARRSRRVFNMGLLLGTTALALTLLWTVAAGSVSAISMIRGRDQGVVPAARLAESRILVQQARSAEMVKLVRRDASGDYDRTFDTNAARLTELLDGYSDNAPARDQVAAARAALTRWQSAHQRMNDTLDRGDFAGAAAVATGPGAADSAAQVTALDRALDEAGAATRNTLRSKVSQAIDVLAFLAPGAFALGIAAAVCVGLGLWPRLREYR
ncbi:hypothetical protein [Nocardia mangyaensis]|uniref:hypothetical protein n=1 Tax=Nocardia mangyaensis TaxID=2213200 RepID=UPI002675C969|nr:hypothetical protein [Nocardia mangyaensis]MDO3648931.1 hypothetical protein [Nocardia mangyaensis]